MIFSRYTVDPSDRWLTFVWGRGPLPAGAAFRGVVLHEGAPTSALLEFPTTGSFQIGQARALRGVEPSLLKHLLASLDPPSAS